MQTPMHIVSYFMDLGMAGSHKSVAGAFTNSKLYLEDPLHSLKLYGWEVKNSLLFKVGFTANTQITFP